MDNLRAAAEMALEALEQLDGIDTETECVTIHVSDEIEALRQALAQPEQESVDIHCPSCLHSFSIVPVAKCEWVSLTDEQIAEVVGSPIDEVYLSDFRKVEAASEREACAKVCEGLTGRSYEFDMGRLHSAAAIRARGDKHD